MEELRQMQDDSGASDIFIYDARRAELSGISDVTSFTDNSIIAESKFGTLSIDGEGLRIEKFASSSGELTVSGKIIGFYYFDTASREKKKKGLFR